MKTNLQGGLSPKTLRHLVSLALLSAALGAHAASVGAGGYTNDFSSPPAAADFATATIAGGSGDVVDAAGLDAAVAALTAAGVTTTLPSTPVIPAPPAGTATYNSTDKNLQSRPTSVKMNVIMATLINNAGANASSVSLSYSLTQSNIVDEAQVNGVRVYYSLTGAASSWTYVPTWSATAAGLVSASVTLAAPWNVGSPLYLLFADDNGSGTDTANQIDNFSFAVSGPSPELPVAIVSQPQSQTVFEGQSATFTVGVSGNAPITFQWYRGTDPIANATNASYTLVNAQLADNSAQFSVVAANVASNISSTATSSVAVLTVNQILPGTVVAWGDNSSGQTSVPVGLSGVTAIAAGFYHTVALKNNGTVVAWGGNGDGQSTIPGGLSGVIAIAAGDVYTVAVKGDGTVTGWGDNGFGQLNIPVGLNGVTAVTAGRGHTVALKNNGTVVAWGRNEHGQASVPAGLSGVIAISAGDVHTLALKSDGTVVAWGYNGFGEAVVPAGVSGVIAIAAGGYHNVVLKNNGALVAWGLNSAGQTNIPAGLSGVIALAGGSEHSVALKNDGTVVAWGRNIEGQTTIPAGLSGVTAIASGTLHTVALVAGSVANLPPSITSQPVGAITSVGGTVNFSVTVTGTAPFNYQWNFNAAPLLGATNSTLALSGVQTNQAGGYTVVIANGSGSVTSSVAVLTVNQILPGTVVAWGDNGSGQTNVPAGLSGVTAIAAGFYHTVALKIDGTVVAWGGNGNGQSTIPAGLSGVIAIAAGDVYTLAVKGDGTVTGWGDNGFGQLNIPVGLNGVTAVTAGRGHTVALKNNGTVVAWGRNEHGQASVPAGLSGVIAISAGDVHTLALKSDGTVVAWGYNGFGEAVVPAGVSGVIAIAAGGYHNVVLKNNGALVAWGLNSAGQTNIPAGLTGVIALAGGSEHTVALKGDGTVVAWGRNVEGQTTIPAGLSGVTAIAAGTRSTVALLAGTPAPPSITSQPQTAIIPVGTNVTFDVTVTGTSPFSFQWSFNGSPLSGATNSTLAFSNVQLELAGDYSVVVANQYGSVTSQVATLTVFIPRTLALQAQAQAQEGTRVQIPLTLISTGDIAGMTFTINYNTNYLRDLQFNWSPLLLAGFNQENQSTPGVVSASFALSENIPAGTQTVATLDFLLRSVPATLDTALTVTLQDASDAQGNTVPVNGTVVQGCSQHILVRRIIGDNNANDRLDVGDATVILRFLAALDPVRAWDITGNDVNQNTSLDSGDVTKVLRAAAGIDPQPPVPPGVSKNRSSQAAPPAQLLQPAGQFILTPDRTNGTPGQQVKVQVRLQNNSSPLSGTAFTLNYPTNALRLANSSAYQLGPIVPGGTLAQWNVAPSQNNFTTQNGHLTLAASSANVWPSSNGVIAEITFTIQAGATSQYLWPLTVTSAETAASGFDNHLFPTANASFIGRVPVAGQLASLVRLPGGQFQFSLAGDASGTYAVDASADLINWTAIQTNSVPAGGSLLVQDPAATGQPYRFYRVRSLY